MVFSIPAGFCLPLRTDPALPDLRTVQPVIARPCRQAPGAFKPPLVSMPKQSAQPPQDRSIQHAEPARLWRPVPQLLWAWALFLGLAFSAGPARASELDTAQRQWLAGQRSTAVATLEAALQQTPDELKLRFALGVMRMELGELAAALQIFSALTQDFPDLADPYNNLAVIHASQGELDLARVELERALNLQPGHAQAQENLGDVLLRQALRAYQRAQQALAAPSGPLALKLKRTHDLLQETGTRGR